MASLTSLRSDLNYWNGQVSDLNEKIRKLNRRRTEVEGIKNGLKSTVESNSSDVNKKLLSTRNKLDDAIDYTGEDSKLNAILSGKDEGAICSDSNLASIDSELQRELNDIDRQLGEAESSLRTANGKVSDIKAAIAAEEKREREAATRKALEAITNVLRR